MPKCANPLFLRWVKQFHAEKDYRKRGGPPRATGYENAIRALETCTKTYAHPADMRGKVSGVGPTTIERLTEKLEEYCESRGIPMPELASKPSRRRKASTTKGSGSFPEVIVEKVERGADEEDEAGSGSKPSAAKRKRATPRKAAAKKAQVSDDNDEDGEDGGDIEEEYVPPPPKKRARRVSSRKTTRVKATEDDEDD